MAVQLNHTIVPAHDKLVDRAFLAEILGLEPPTPVRPFQCVETANGVSLDYADHDGVIPSTHYAFLVSEEEFDAIFARVTERGSAVLGRPLGIPGRASSTTTGEASTSKTRPATTWRS